MGSLSHAPGRLLAGGSLLLVAIALTALAGPAGARSGSKTLKDKKSDTRGKLDIVSARGKAQGKRTLTYSMTLAKPIPHKLGASQFCVELFTSKPGPHRKLADGSPPADDGGPVPAEWVGDSASVAATAAADDNGDLDSGDVDPDDPTVGTLPFEVLPPLPGVGPRLPGEEPDRFVCTSERKKSVPVRNRVGVRTGSAKVRFSRTKMSLSLSAKSAGKAKTYYWRALAAYRRPTRTCSALDDALGECVDTAPNGTKLERFSR